MRPWSGCMDPSDSQLLEEFARGKVRPGVWLAGWAICEFGSSTVRRQVRDANLADDVAQAVFIVLARRASSVSPNCLARHALGYDRRGLGKRLP
jgi:hypothetical protein